MATASASAPGKLMLFGEHAVIYGRPAIVTAVNQRITVELAARREGIRLTSPSLGIKNEEIKLGANSYSKDVRFVAQTLALFSSQFGNPGGMDILIHSEFKKTYGFGSSSAVTVALASALCKKTAVKLSEKELFDFCYSVVLSVQGVGSGFDIAAAIWGGTLYFVGGGKQIIPLKTSSLPLVVGYTGVKADTPAIVREVRRLVAKRKEWANRLFSQIKSVVEQAKTALENEDMYALGGLMNQNQAFLVKLGVSSPQLDRLISASINAGAYGAKLSGAGKGDCMIALVEEKNRPRVEEAIRSAGGEILNVKLNAEGVK